MLRGAPAGLPTLLSSYKVPTGRSRKNSALRCLERSSAGDAGLAERIVFGVALVAD